MISNFDTRNLVPPTDHDRTSGRDHLGIPVDRYGHCNFTREEALFSFAIMLFYDGILGEVSGRGARGRRFP